MSPSGRSTVEIVADLSRFGGQLERDLNRQLRQVDVDVQPVARQISDTIEDAVDSIKGSFDDLEDHGERAFRETADEAAKMAREIDGELEQVDRQIAEVERSVRELAREFARTGDQDVFAKLRMNRAALANLRQVRDIVDEIGDEARQTARQLDEVGDQASQASAAGSAGFFNFGRVLTSLVGSAGSLSASLPSPAGIALITAALVGMGAAIPVVLGLGAALADLAGLLPALPAAAAVGQATMGALRLSLLGVSEAIDAVIDADPEKIREAMKGLAPAARDVVREFQRLLPSLKGTQQLIQQRFFEELNGSLTYLADRALPTMRVGLSDVSAALGRAGSELGRVLASDRALQFFEEVFGSAERSVDRFGDSIESILNIVFELGEAGLPMIEQFVDFLLDGADSLAAFLSSAEGQTALTDFIDDALATLRELWDLTKAVGGFLSALFGGADDEGRSFIATLTEMFTRMEEGLRSQEGQELLQNLLDLLPLVAAAIQQSITAWVLLGKAINAVATFWGFMINFWQALPGQVAAAAQAVGGWFVSAWNTASAAVSSFFTAVGEFFTNLPGMILGWITAAGAALLGGLQAAFHAALMAVGVGIGLILFTVTQLPGMIWNALVNLPGQLRALFVSAWNGARKIAVTVAEQIIAAAIRLGKRIIEAVTNLPGRLRGIFSSALSAARSAAVSGFNSIVSFVASVPGRLSRLAGRFTSAGKSVIRGFFNGLKATAGFAGNVGSAVVSAVRRGLNSVIGSINSGIASIDRVLPGSLPRIPYLARGGMTLGPTLAALSETGQREVVLPIQDERTMAALRDALGLGGGGPAITLMPGAVVVEIHGPADEDQARRAGAAAGQALLDVLDRRDTHLAVRTL